MRTLAENNLTPAGELQRPGTLKDLVFQEVLKQLLAGTLEPGKIYSAKFFADRLGVSRTPAREALLKLANMGFLVCLDVRGFKVKEFTDQEIRDVFETRRVIESYVVTQMVGRLSGDDLERLEQSLALMARRAARKDVAGFLEADREFHMIPVRGLGNQFLAGVMENIRNHIAIFGSQALAHASRFDEVLREHSAILDGFRSRRRPAAVRALRHHLDTTERYLLARTTAED